MNNTTQVPQFQSMPSSELDTFIRGCAEVIKQDNPNVLQVKVKDTGSILEIWTYDTMPHVVLANLAYRIWCSLNRSATLRAA